MSRFSEKGYYVKENAADGYNLFIDWQSTKGGI